MLHNYTYFSKVRFDVYDTISTISTIFFLFHHSSFIPLVFHTFTHLFIPYSALCGGELTDATGTVLSPDWPQSYSKGQDCVWQIHVSEDKRIELDVQMWVCVYGCWCVHVIQVIHFYSLVNESATTDLAQLVDVLIDVFLSFPPTKVWTFVTMTFSPSLMGMTSCPMWLVSIWGHGKGSGSCLVAQRSLFSFRVTQMIPPSSWAKASWFTIEVKWWTIIIIPCFITFFAFHFMLSIWLGCHFTWSSPEVEPNDTCPTLPPIEFGWSSSSHVSLVRGSVITYQCQPGYDIVGSDIITCQWDLSWSNSPPTCVKSKSTDSFMNSVLDCLTHLWGMA